MAEKKTCFIIMPITTPEFMLEKYRDRDEHFEHVLKCLFIPSIEKAEFSPIPPKASGSDLIHAEIISNLESADLVLCDMSCLNPNVFFEFGLRTALNKPVCIVKDEFTIKIPFDASILNYWEYQSSLEPWTLTTEIDKLMAHIKASDERSKGKNTLWKYFGLRKEARPFEGESQSENKLDLLSIQLDSISNKIDSIPRYEYSMVLPSSGAVLPPTIMPTLEQIYGKPALPPKDFLFEYFGSMMGSSAELVGVDLIGSNVVSLIYSGTVNEKTRKAIADLCQTKFNRELHMLPIAPPKGGEHK